MTPTNYMNMVALFVHRFDLLVPKLFHCTIAIDEILIEIGALLQLARCDQSQIDDHVIRVALFVEQIMHFIESFFFIIGRSHALHNSHELIEVEEKCSNHQCPSIFHLARIWCTHGIMKILERKLRKTQFNQTIFWFFGQIPEWFVVLFVLYQILQIGICKCSKETVAVGSRLSYWLIFRCQMWQFRTIDDIVRVLAV